MNFVDHWIIELVDEKKLKCKDHKHYIELGSELELTGLHNITKDDDLVQDNQQS